jgi:hypothetical protein
MQLVLTALNAAMPLVVKLAHRKIAAIHPKLSLKHVVQL